MLVAYGDFSLQPPQLLGLACMEPKLCSSQSFSLIIIIYYSLSWVISFYRYMIGSNLNLHFLYHYLLYPLCSLVSAAHCSEKLFTMVCIEVDLLLSENEFPFSKYISNSSLHRTKWSQLIIPSLVF